MTSLLLEGDRTLCFSHQHFSKGLNIHKCIVGIIHKDSFVDAQKSQMPGNVICSDLGMDDFTRLCSESSFFIFNTAGMRTRLLNTTLWS